MRDLFKKGYEAWDRATTAALERLLRNPLLLRPAGTVLSSVMRAQAARNRLVAELWGGLGLPTKRDQERMLHLLNELHSRVLDLEERLDGARR